MLCALEGVPDDDPLIAMQVEKISESIEITGKGRFRDVFTNGESRLFNRACLACAGQMFQQMVSSTSGEEYTQATDTVLPERHQRTRILRHDHLPRVSRTFQRTGSDSGRLCFLIPDFVLANRRTYCRSLRKAKADGKCLMLRRF